MDSFFLKATRKDDARDRREEDKDKDKEDEENEERRHPRMGKIDLLELQSRCKRDPDGYRDDFLMQLEHFKAVHAVFSHAGTTTGATGGTANKDHENFGDLVTFLAHTHGTYENESSWFPGMLVSLVDANCARLDASLRRRMVAALIVLRNRNFVRVNAALPLFFKLFRCPDKQLRSLVFKHVVADVKLANKKKKNEAYNRVVRQFLRDAVRDENPVAVKKALAIVTELYRRNIWNDAKSVNLVVEACYHEHPKILVAGLKFFLGQDEAAERAAEEGGETDEEEDDVAEGNKNMNTNQGGKQLVSKDDVFKAYHKGLASSKRKKQAKLKRMIASVRKQQIKAEGNNGEARFAAMQLIDDPQGFAEMLFKKLKEGAQAFETKMLLLQVVSRVVGLHQLILLNFYPFLQRYIQPNQRDVTKLLAAAATACHELVPPDAIEPLLRQLVTQFVHDKARPEVVAVGINSVREICNRTPLVMTEELLRDLSQYKKARDKPVATAARALIALFRELAPSLLEKKDRGKGADLEKNVKAFGTKEVSERVDGAELLQLERIKRKRLVAEIENMTEFDNSDNNSDVSSDEEGDAVDVEEYSNEEDGEDIELSENELEQNDILPVKKKLRANGKLTLAELKRRHKIAVLKAKKVAEHEEKLEEEEQLRLLEEENPIEQEKIFGDEDFKKIKALRTQSKIDENLEKMGAKKVKNAAETDLTRLVMRKADRASERRVNPDALAAIGIRRAHDKASRLATVLAGREDNEFGSSTARRLKKTGGASNKEKAKKKQLPLAARIHAATRRRNAPVQKGKRQLGRFRKV